MEKNKSSAEVKKLLDKYNKLKAEADELKDSDPLKSEQKQWDAAQVARDIEKIRD
ncbi:MAG: hypothetical protein WBG71_00590 [Leeuwenhoekiella sp.]